MSHDRVALALSDYLNGSLALDAASEVEAHLFDCRSCRATLDELRRTVELLRGLRSGFEAPDLSDGVMARIRAGDAQPSLLDRLRAQASRLLSGPLGAPLATAAIGLALLAVLPRIEIEVSIPGRARPEPVAAEVVARPSLPIDGGPRATSTPLLARRVNESLRSDPFGCLAPVSTEACRDYASMTRLARENVWAFMAHLEEVPEPHRNDWLGTLSRFAARSGEASDVAARLRATGDPSAQRMAIHFDEVR